MKQYEEALRLWGKRKIEKQGWVVVDIDPDTVEVSMDFNAGYACCGGRDPECYCSYAESPSANVRISGQERGTLNRYEATIDADSFDFAKVLGEILDEGEGVLIKTD